jgi:hypothetical protein
MPASTIKVLSDIQGCRFRVKHYVIFFSQTKLAGIGDRVENPGSRQSLPGYVIGHIFTFQFPDILAECCAAFVSWVSEV